MPGPSKKPTKLKLLEGTARADRRLKNEVDPPVGMPESPAHVTGTARAEWDRMSQYLFNLGLLSECDMAALAAYCVAYGRWADAESMLNQSPSLIVETQQGNIIQSPLVGVANTAMKLMLKSATEFGMTPAARTRVAVQKQEKSPERKARGF